MRKEERLPPTNEGQDSAAMTVVTQAEVPGLAARRAAADLLDGVLRSRRPLDEQLDGTRIESEWRALPERDRAFAHRIAATTLRRLGTLRRMIHDALDRGFPADAPRIESILLTGAAQLLFLDIPDHAAVDLAVRLVQGNRRHARYAGLINAVLRRLARTGIAAIANLDPLCLDTPEWMLARWQKSFGAATARAIAFANRAEPPLDLTVKSDPDSWAGRLGGRTMPTGSVRLIAPGAVSSLPGYAEGSWWVQDAAAALPARLLREIDGRSVADLCAAPGGKTAQLALAGAKVTAVDRSEARVARLRENLRRLRLEAATQVADAEEWPAANAVGPFDAVLVDAPCTATGTIRRHPDIAWLKSPAELELLTALQRRLLDRAIDLTRSGGTIVFATCSLEPEEGEDIVAAVLDRDSRVRRDPIAESELPGLAGLLNPAGELRTLPCHWPDRDPSLAGLAGFFAARLTRL
jgi:16S rRNA (cytosine967-C5)-methyltransferase